MNINHNSNLVKQTLLFKIFPLLMIVPLFGVTSVLVKEQVLDALLTIGIDLTVEKIAYTMVFVYSGLALLIEMVYALPETGKSNAGVFGAVLLASLATGTFIFAGAIFTGFYDPQEDTEIFNVILSVLMLIIIGMMITQAREEIFHHRRLSMHAKLSRILG